MMKNKEKEGLLIGVNLGVSIPVTFESFEHNRNFNKTVIAKQGQGMSYNLKSKHVRQITKM